MSDAPHEPRPQQPPHKPTLEQRVGAKAVRKLRAQRHAAQGVWFGLGMMGLIGWSVALPTLLGAAFGYWLDRHHTGRHGWTLAMMALGLGLGCLNAWRWVSQEEKAMRDEQEDHPDE